MLSQKKLTGSKTAKTKKKSQPIPEGIQQQPSVISAKPMQRSEKAKIKTNYSEDFCNDDPQFHSQVERFIEISKYFSSPLRKTATYNCSTQLVTFPNPFRVEFRRGTVTTHNIKFSNVTLQPVYVRLYKIIPDLEQIKFINLSISRCKRIPPGLSFSLGFVYDDFNEKDVGLAKMIFVASRKSITPCYQVCEVDLDIDTLKVRSSTST